MVTAICTAQVLSWPDNTDTSDGKADSDRTDLPGDENHET